MSNGDEARWYSIQGDLAAIKLLVISLAKTSHDYAALRAVFLHEKEIFDTALLHSELPETALQFQQRKQRYAAIVSIVRQVLAKVEAEYTLNFRWTSGARIVGLKKTTHK